MIPRVMHRIWFGGSMPDHLAAYGETWDEKHPHWEHRLWTEENLPELLNQSLFDHAKEIAPHNVGQLRADIARYELLYRFGGVYVDCDFECLRPIDELLCGVECFSAWEVQDCWAVNGILGATPHHPFITALVAGLPTSVHNAKPGDRPTRFSGPQYLTRTLRSGFADAVTVFPQAWFIPYGYRELQRQGEHFPDAYAVHHWWNARSNPHRAGRPRAGGQTWPNSPSRPTGAPTESKIPAA